MKPAFEDMSLQIPAATAEPEDYTGEDGLLYCGKCRTPKEAYFPADKVALFGRDRHPACLLYTSPSPRDVEESRMPSSA